MSQKDMKVSLLLSVAQTGLSHLQDVIRELEGAGVATDEFQQEAKELGEALARLERDSALMDTFGSLKRETAGLSKQLDVAAQQVDALAAELERAAQASAQATAAQAQSAQKLSAARAWQAQLQEAIAATRQEMQELKQASGESIAPHLTERLADARQQLKSLQAEAAVATQNTRLLAAANKENEAAAKNAARAEEALTGQYQRAVQEAGKLSASFNSKNKALSQTREHMQAAGLQTSQLALQQKALAERMQQISQSGDGLVARMRSTADAAKLQSAAVEKAGKAWATFQRGIAAGLGFAAAQIGLSGLGSALGTLRTGIEEVLRVGGGFEQMRAQLATLYGSIEQGQNAFAWIRDFGKTVPYELEAVTGAFTKLKAMGLDPMDGSLQAIADQAAALGGGVQTLEGVVLALGQAWTKQKLQGEEALQLIERGVPVWDLLSRATGKSAVQLQQLASAGQLGREAIAALIAEMGKANAGAAAGAMNTWNGQIALLKSNWQEFLDTIATSGILDLFREEVVAINQAIAELARTGELKAWAQAASDAIVSLYEAIKSGIGFFKDWGNELGTLTEVAIGFKTLSLGKTALGWGAEIALSAQNIEKSASVIAGAGKLAAAGWIGWNVGAWLREEFLVIEQAGIALAAGLTKAAARAQHYWESLKAVFTDDTLEAAEERFSQKLRQIDDDYAALFESAAQARQGQEQLAQAAETAAAAVQQQAAQTQQAAAAMGQAMAAAVKTIDEVDQAMQRAGVSAQATGSALEAAFLQAVPKAQTLADIQALQDKLQALADAGRIGTDGVKAITGAIADHAQSIGQAMVGAIATIDQVDQAMRRAGVSAQATASALQEAFAQAIGQAKTLADIEALEKKLKDLEAAGRIGAEGVKAIAEAIALQRQSIEATDQARQAMLEGFKELGADGAAALGQISEGAQKAIAAVDKIAAAAKEAGLGVNEAAQAIEKAFTAAVPKADSLQAIEALESRLKAAGQAGQIGAEGIARVQAALDKQRAAIEQQLPGIQSLEEALKQLGVTPQKELDRLAQSAKDAFEAVKQSGQATPREINEAWKKMAEAAIAANDGVADASLKAAAQQHGFAIETDKAGKSIIKSMEEAKEATEGVGQAAGKAGEKMAEAAQKAKDAWADGSLVEQAEKHNAALGKIEGSWIRADVAASQYAKQIAEVVWEQGKAIAQMTEEHARLVQQMEALSEQQRNLEAVNNDAVRGLEALRLRYLELTGDQEAAAELKMQMARQEIDLKLALLEIDLQRAQIAGDTAKVKKMELQIAALKEQLTWLDKIHAKEKELRKEREREERSHGRSSGGGGSGSSSAGSLPPPAPAPQPQPAPPAPPAPPVHITLHAHGITDPVRLAKAIEPELARLARLAR